MLKQIIKGKTVYFCDVCGIEIHPRDTINLSLIRFWNDKKYELCSKDGELVIKFIEKLKQNLQGGMKDEKLKITKKTNAGL